ncbi:hypothetical protein NET02_02805 [Thermomicrobiaceae bacterium CFH 74404]|uniref:Uncharacterized protein n=2 Tax=Thermomicrobia TaxID=189775 RepID=A0AA42BBR6_9BACT|nr:hypothetical protein [Thermalbibacter longus]MCM8748068.1 hypothetical protein [Thermalbibacter longus]
MAETHPFRLRPEEIAERARKFFGPGGLGMNLMSDEGGRLRFEDVRGFVELDIRADANNQSRVTFQYEGFEREVHEFRRKLAKQAAEETRSPE